MKFQTLKVVGARQNNLKNISLEIPKKKLVVFTGVSGSGKSSLVFDTIYAEGHRKYVESLSSYARQFLARMQKPDVDYISGLSPAIAIQQRTASNNPRSTVGTITEIYDYLKILFARIGRTFSPISGEEVKKDTVTSVVDFILEQKKGARIYVLSPFKVSQEKRSFDKELEIALQKGFTRVFHENQVYEMEEILQNKKLKWNYHNTQLLIDRLIVDESIKEEEFRYRISDSVQTAFFEGHGDCWVVVEDTLYTFCERFEKDGMQFEEPSPQMFNFNSPLGACPDCQGSGEVNGLNLKLVFPNPHLSVRQGAVKLWDSPNTQQFAKQFIKNVEKYHEYFDLDKPYHQLSSVEKKLLLEGGNRVVGVYESFDFMLNRSYELRVFAMRFLGRVDCPACLGSRIKKTASYVKVHGYSIQELLQLPVSKLLSTFQSIPFNEFERKAAQRLIYEIESRLSYLLEVGLGYLTLNRRANTLSGGEMQRIKLSTSLGSNLTGSLYILDEPSIGLHSRDSVRLLNVLKKLRDLGNSVLVVEHDETIMKSADWIIDIGPYAGEQGGEVVFSGEFQAMLVSNSLTSQYLSQKTAISIPSRVRDSKNYIELCNVNIHNIQNLTVKIPLDRLVVIAGVSGSGKTSLIKNVFYPAVKNYLSNIKWDTNLLEKLTIAHPEIREIEMVSQNALNVSSRSNPATYLGIFDFIRDLFAKKADVKHELSSHHFSFNVEGGRCDACQGEGYITVEMQFLPDVEMVCEVCNGKRYKNYVLDITYQGKNIYEVLQMTVSEAIEFFAKNYRIIEKLQALKEVGLEYLRLGQSTSTLSGGEAQRLKLAAALSMQQKNTIFVFDEPTTGLHFSDIQKLLNAFYRLIDNGNTVIVIEHQLDVIKCADWLIEMGPEGGDEGGQIIFEGKPQDLIHKNTPTAPFLKEKFINL
ncbi:MAG: UvrABC system protein A [Bacteroidia bacterium]|nr:MAG: UvrABC system protein A [Bacteroidia bacterium]